MSGLLLLSNTYWTQIKETSHCVFCNELLVLLLAANIKVTNILHKLIRMSRYTIVVYYYKICTIYQRNYLVHFIFNCVISWEQIQTMSMTIALCTICYIKVANYSRVHISSDEVFSKILKKWRNEKNSLKTQKMHFLPVLELMSDSLTTI